LVAILHGKGTTLPKLLQYVFYRMLTDKIQVANIRFSKAGLSFFWNMREHPKTIAAITLDGAIAAIVVKIGSAYLLLSAIP
jgi:hypothetical protein